MQRHLDTTRAQLASEGLPSSAPNVRLVVSDSDPAAQGNAVLRAAVGPVGPGQGADAHLLRAEHARVDALYDGIDPRGRTSMDQLARTGVDVLTAYVDDHRRELGRIREMAQKDPSRPTVAAMSWGGTVAQTALNLAERAVAAPRGSQLHQEVSRALGRAPTPRDTPAVARMLAERMQRRIDDPQGGQALRDAKASLGRELRDASEQDRVSVFTSMGNGHEDASMLGNPAWGASIIHDVPGHVSVGATTLGDPARVGDERIGNFSSDGQVEVAAPGVQTPVGSPGRDGRPTRIDGTSFSTPYVAGVAALMLQASPRLTTAQIQEILQGTARNVPGHRDGAGVVDIVAAVRTARELRAQ